MSVRFNAKGTRLLCLERRQPPTIYDVLDGSKLRLLATDFTNDCTLKSACFAGKDDELAVAGSDNHGVYIWSVNRSIEEPLLVLKGHRSIVNNVRYNNNICTLASSGVEKMIKLWAPVPLPHSTGGLDQSGIAPESASVARRRFQTLGQSSRPNPRSTDEDIQMLAFFDVLTSRHHDAHLLGIDSDSSDDSSSSNGDRIMAFFDMIGSDSSSADSSEDNSDFMFDVSPSSSSSSSSSSSDSSPSSPAAAEAEAPAQGGTACLSLLQHLLAQMEAADEGDDDDDDSSSSFNPEDPPPVFLRRQLRQRPSPSSSNSSSNDDSP